MNRYILLLLLSTPILHGCSAPSTDKTEAADWLKAVIKHPNTYLRAMVLQKKDTINVKNAEGSTPLAVACSLGKSDAVHILLEAKANPNSTDDEGFTPLMETACRGCNSCTELPKRNPSLVSCNNCLKNAQSLIRAKADVNALDIHGYSALLYASMHKKWRIVDYLLAVSANPNVYECTKIGPLHYAAHNHANRSVKLLIECKAELDAQNGHDNTPSMLACDVHNEQALQLLLKAGADFNLANVDGLTTHDLIREAQNKTMQYARPTILKRSTT